MSCHSKLFYFYIYFFQTKENKEASSDAQAKAVGFVKLLLSRKTLLSLHLLWDITDVLSHLSLALQKHGCTVAEGNAALKSARSGLQKLLNRYTKSSMMFVIFTFIFLLYNSACDRLDSAKILLKLGTNPPKGFSEMVRDSGLLPVSTALLSMIFK